MMFHELIFGEHTYECTDIHQCLNCEKNFSLILYKDLYWDTLLGIQQSLKKAFVLIIIIKNKSVVAGNWGWGHDYNGIACESFGCHSIY